MKGLLFVCGLLATTVSGHIQMVEPVPLRSPKSKDQSGKIDYSYTNPLSTDGSDYPCKGYAGDAFKSVADYSPGQQYSLKLEGSATHNGGSCQVGLSYDKGKTFRVIHSMIGGCPLTKEYQFQIPQNAPSGEALLSWSWFNKVGNREMYMNCAQVTIGGGGGGGGGQQPKENKAISRRDGFDSLPEIFQANNAGPGKCRTVEGQDVNFPMPGPSKEGNGEGKGYECEGSAPFLGGGGGGGGSPKAGDNNNGSKGGDNNGASKGGDNNGASKGGDNNGASKGGDNNGGASNNNNGGSNGGSNGANNGAGNNNGGANNGGGQNNNGGGAQNNNGGAQPNNDGNNNGANSGGQNNNDAKNNGGNSGQNNNGANGASNNGGGNNGGENTNGGNNNGGNNNGGNNNGGNNTNGGNNNGGNNNNGGGNGGGESNKTPNNTTDKPNNNNENHHGPAQPPKKPTPPASDKPAPKVPKPFGDASKDSSTLRTGSTTDKDAVTHAWMAKAKGCKPNTVICAPDGQTWALCDNGNPIHMGNVAAGTACKHGAMEHSPMQHAA